MLTDSAGPSGLNADSHPCLCTESGTADPAPSTGPGCAFVTQTGRPCQAPAPERFGGLPLCRQHAERVAVHAERELEDPRSALALQARAMLLAADRHAARRADADRAERRASRARVYFAEREQWVKIGWTVDVDKRMAQLARGGTVMPAGMTVGPLSLRAVLRGGTRLESRLHTRFADDREAGEWFRQSPALLAFLAERAPNRPRGASGGRCRSGQHEMTLGNTLWDRSGRRRCRECTRLRGVAQRRTGPAPLPPETELRARQLAQLDAHLVATGDLPTVSVIKEVLNVDTRRAVRLLADRHNA